MFKRNAKLALALSAAFLVQANASAGDLTLFTGQGFQGRDLRLNMPVRDLTAMDFNDRAGSMVVRSGRWEVCVHADFRDCEIIEPGEYPTLNRLGGQISSLREIAGGDNNRRDYRDDNRGGRGQGGDGVIMFDGLDLRGRSFPLRGDVPNFQQVGFNDMAQSMVIQSGTWEFCVHANFGGECRVYGPGEYRNLDRAFYRAISSARLVSDDDGGRGRGRDRDRDNRRNRDGVELFSTMGFSGERVQVRDETRNMEHINFNDRAGSLIVYSGRWEFCQHADFRGQCLTYGPGRYDRLGGLNNQISSMRRVR